VLDGRCDINDFFFGFFIRVLLCFAEGIRSGSDAELHSSFCPPSREKWSNSVEHQKNSSVWAIHWCPCGEALHGREGLEGICYSPPNLPAFSDSHHFHTILLYRVSYEHIPHVDEPQHTFIAWRVSCSKDMEAQRLITG
jgi:hypothetical protein